MNGEVERLRAEIAGYQASCDGWRDENRRLQDERDKFAAAIDDIAQMMDAQDTTMIDAWDGIRLIIDQALAGKS